MKKLFLLLVASISFPIYALDISVNKQNSIVIEGKIETGDYIKVAKFLQSKSTIGAFILNKIILNSPGGDVAEALLISNLIKTASGFTKVPEDGVCFSACFIVWSGGSMRELENNAKLGVHRMTLTNENTTVLNAEKIIKPLANAVEIYLLDSGIPRVIIDKMNETSPSDIFLIDMNWLLKNNLDYATNFMPYFVDVAERKCGDNSYVKFKKDSASVTGRELGQWLTCINQFRQTNAAENITPLINLISFKKK